MYVLISMLKNILFKCGNGLKLLIVYGIFVSKGQNQNTCASVLLSELDTFTENDGERGG